MAELTIPVDLDRYLAEHEAYIALQDRCDDLEAKLAAVTAERDEAQAVIDGVREVRSDYEVSVALLAALGDPFASAAAVSIRGFLARLNKVDGL